MKFSYANKTKTHFAQGQIKQLSREIPKAAKILVTPGGGSIKKMAYASE